MKLTVIIQRSPDGWLVGQIEQIPGVITQGRTIEELKFMLQDALELYLEAQQELTARDYEGQSFERADFGFLQAA